MLDLFIPKPCMMHFPFNKTLSLHTINKFLMKPEHLLHIIHICIAFLVLYRSTYNLNCCCWSNCCEQIKFGCRVDAYKIVIIEKNVGWMVVVNFFL